MNITIGQKELAKALNTVGRAAAARSTLPVLQNIMLVAEWGKLELSATNLEFGIKMTIPCNMNEPGSTTVPSKTLNSVVGNLTEDITLSTTKSEKLKIVSGKSKHEIPGLSTEEFPPFPEISGEPIRLDGDKLHSMINKVIFATSKDISRPILNGALISCDDGLMTMVATDGFRLAVYSEPASGNFSLVVPSKSLVELSRLLENGTISIYTKNGQVTFQGDNWELVSQLIDGNYPDYKQLIPKTHTFSAVAYVSALSTALKQVRAHSSVTKVKINGSIEISAKDSIDGFGVVDVEAEHDGENMTFGLDGDYFQEALKTASTPKVEIQAKSATDPIVFKPVGDEKHTIIIMPMHLDEEAQSEPVNSSSDED